jgi:hypothetical protein
MHQLTEIVRNIGRIPQLREQRPLGWRLSHPLPERSDGKLTWRSFLYPSPPLKDQPRSVGRPRAVLTVSHDGTKLLEYLDLGVRDVFPAGPDPVGSFPHPAIEAWEHKRIGQATRELWEALGTLGAQSLDSEPDAQARQVVMGARTGIFEPGLLPYYDALVPGFWSWLAG